MPEQEGVPRPTAYLIHAESPDRADLLTIADDNDLALVAWGEQDSIPREARVLAYLLETTERFGMATRTELILLQRTMVVVEGVARTLDPDANIFEAAKPVVEDYIRENLGPAAVLDNMRETAEILTPGYTCLSCSARTAGDDSTPSSSRSSSSRRVNRDSRGSTPAQIGMS